MPAGDLGLNRRRSKLTGDRVGLLSGVGQAFLEQFAGNLSSTSVISQVALRVLQRRQRRLTALAARSYNPADYFTHQVIRARLDELRRQKKEFQFDHMLKSRPQQSINPIANYFRSYFQTTGVQPFSYYHTEKYVKKNFGTMAARCLQNKDLHFTMMADSLQVQVLEGMLQQMENGHRTYFDLHHVIRAGVKELSRDKVAVEGLVEAVYLVSDKAGDLVTGSTRPRQYPFELELGANNTVVSLRLLAE